MKKLLVVLCAVLLLMSGCGKDYSIDKKLVIGLDDEFAPMGFRDEKGNIIGFDVDMAKELAKRLGTEIEFKPIDWDNKEEELKNGNIDIIWNGLDITPERQENILYSKPYMDNRQVLLVRKNNTQHIHSLAGLYGKIVATQAGSNSEDYVNETESLKNNFAAFKTYATVKEGFDSLLLNEVDVIIIDEIAGRYGMTRYPDKFEIIDFTVGPVTEFGIGFRKDDIELRDKVQEVFDGMVKDGTAQKISMKWFQADLIKSRR